MDRMQKREPEFSAPMTPPLRLGVSMCLLGETVRYDGGHKKDGFLTDTLGRYVECVPDQGADAPESRLSPPI